MSRRHDLPRRLRVLLVDPHEVSRAAIRALLQTAGLQVVGDVAEADAALALGAQVAPDVVVLDIEDGGPEALRSARALGRLPSVPAVVLTSSEAVTQSLDEFAFVPKPDIDARKLCVAMRSSNNDSEEQVMSMQAYMDNIHAKTGKTPDDFFALARAAGLLEPGVKPAQVVAWLKQEHGLGHGHAMAIVSTIKAHTAPRASVEEKTAAHFAGKKARWRPAYEEIVRALDRFGADTDVLAGKSYLSLRRAGRKFAIVQVTAERLDVGVKLRGVPAGGRLERSGKWNSMVTHRIRCNSPEDVDRGLLELLERAYAGSE
jgi:CheY-like chemotaxis protein